MTPKGKKQVNNQTLEELVPVVRAKVTNSRLRTLLQNALHQLFEQDEELDKAIKGKPNKKDENEK